MKENLEKNPEELEKRLGHPPTMSLLEFADKHAPGLIENFGLHMMLKHLTNPDRIQEFMDMDWAAHSIPSARNELLTCDRPLWYFENPQHEQFTMVMPLSPRTLFVASKTAALSQRITTESDSRIADKVNTSIISRARERVYGRAHIRFAERIFGAKNW
jgi:hypothetical protein